MALWVVGACTCGGGGHASAPLATTTTTTTTPAQRAILECHTSRFAWAPTSTRAPGRAAPEPQHDPEVDHDHGHGRAELVLPLVRGRSRCPSRGRVWVRIAGARPGSTVEVRAFGQIIRGPLAADGRLGEPLALAGQPPGRHPVEVSLDGTALDVPAVEVIGAP